jgi:hypothetical protein
MKKWYKSKTIWANGLAVLAVILEGAGITNILTQAVQVETVAVIMGGVNLVLRFVTEDSIST